MLCQSPWLPVAILLQAAFAWDKDGHEAIGMITMSALENGPVHEVKHLMHGKDAVDVAAWAHKVNAKPKFAWTKALHFQVQPTWACGSLSSEGCVENRCLLKALRYFYGELVQAPNPADHIDWGETSLTDADKVKFLINLIGDMHQPLHLGFAGNDCGRNLTVQFRGKTTTLFDFWDTEMTQAIMKDSPGFWWGGWTHVQRTRSEYEKDSRAWEKEGVAMFDRWADENLKSTCEDIYREPVTHRNITAEIAPVRITERMYESWKQELLSKMLVAGARTAIVLNSILQHRVGPAMHDGTAIKGVEEEEIPRAKLPTGGRKADATHFHGRAWQGPAAFIVNAAILFVVFVLFMFVMRKWQGLDVVIMADRAKHGGDTGKRV
mmetsp:Transcript_13355/g.30457  ORF Transcript_13355/g.30457 Transcript_13355/m.30457 type:complete len:379 (+) Transcript_13355:51-1187(+)